MSERFFVATPIQEPRVSLTGDEARHLAAVMRAKPGDRVILFDGSGAEFEADITAIGKHAVELEVAARQEISRELPFELTLAVALPKGDRQKWLVEKATELGVTRLVPLVTERGVAQPVDAALERLRRAVTEASKQCGRNVLMEIAPAANCADLFAAKQPAATCLLADPQGSALSAIARDEMPICAAIGPEGGFSPAEVQLAKSHDWQLVSLGSRILRVETAALAIAAWVGQGF